MIGRVEISDTNFADRAVTDEYAESKDVSYHCLIVNLTKHEGNKFPYGRYQSVNMIDGLSLIFKVQLIVLSKHLCHIQSDIILIGELTLLLLAG